MIRVEDADAVVDEVAVVTVHVVDLTTDVDEDVNTNGTRKGMGIKK